GLTRNTLQTTFALTCARAEKIGFTRWTDASHFVVANADGSNGLEVMYAFGVSWTPDGKKAAVAALSCSPGGWYYGGCLGLGLMLVTTDSLPTVKSAQLTTNRDDVEPAISPNGQSVAF